jgi:hypothetical protein
MAFEGDIYNSPRIALVGALQYVGGDQRGATGGHEAEILLVHPQERKGLGVCHRMDATGMRQAAVGDDHLAWDIRIPVEPLRLARQIKLWSRTVSVFA